jgi:hypothetical protein
MTSRKDKYKGDYFMNGTMNDVVSDSPRKHLKVFVKEGKKHIEFATVGAIFGAALAGTSGALVGVCVVVAGDFLYDQIFSKKK